MKTNIKIGTEKRKKPEPLDFSQNLLRITGKEKLQCKEEKGDYSIHWFQSGAKKGESCLCGKTTKK